MNDAATVKPSPADASASERAACEAYTLAIDITTGLTIMALASGALVFDGRVLDLRNPYLPQA